MKNTLCGLLLLVSLGSCEKAIERAKEDALIDAITTGYWKVTKYTKGTTDLTGSFNSYKFQFKKTNSVDALKNNTFEMTGLWQGDAANRTITASFVNATEPLTLLNGTWTITNSTWTSVDATQAVDGVNCRLHLDKE
ncbi:MAG TPA: hypothetical protein VD794_10285 [Flavisolibacter sp.]|nr:hypothetical protein [Flavisolibacter sp.]